MKPRYEHSETGWLMLLTMVAALLITLGVAVAGWVGGRALYGFAFPPLFALVALNFYRLAVSVDAEKVVARLGIGLIRRTIPLADIESAKIEKGAWYGGWGLRWTGKGWFWTVLSLDAVALNLKNGGEFLIGTDEPQALLEAIAERLKPL
ncbi:MAG: hypothetical protein A2X32_05370 [Elusimicrobia bacterium GWC2_64_44]|nr:MAG: hypothetical protein A2X32_05370 [Elusimicrobia bacterium GWC2_64_44]